MPFTAFPIPTKVAMKADVGLGNVDNTADVNKPVSGPQQAALDGKAPLVHTHRGTSLPLSSSSKTRWRRSLFKAPMSR